MKKESLCHLIFLVLFLIVSVSFVSTSKLNFSTTDWVLLANTNVYSYFSRSTTFEGVGESIDNVATYVQSSPGKIMQFALSEVDFSGAVYPCNGFTFICSLDFEGAPFVNGELSQDGLTYYLSSSSYTVPNGFNLYN